MEILGRLRASDDAVIIPTAFTVIDLTNPEDEERGVRWWHEVTDRGGERAAIKPYDFITRGTRGIVQPGAEVRGPEIPANHLWAGVRNP